MKFLAPSVVALATIPSTVSAWSLGPSYFNSPMLLQSPSSMLERQRALANRMLEQTDRVFEDMNGLMYRSGKESQFHSPRYELIDDKEKFQLSVDVPGIKMEDIDVSVEEGYLTVRGERVASNENSRFASKFSQTFSLDAAVDVDKLSANLNHGVLTVTAPKDIKKLEANVRKIPITANQIAGADEGDLKLSSGPDNAVPEMAAAPKDQEDVIDLDGKGNEGEEKMEDLTA